MTIGILVTTLGFPSEEGLKPSWCFRLSMQSFHHFGISIRRRIETFLWAIPGRTARKTTLGFPSEEGLKPEIVKAKIGSEQDHFGISIRRRIET